MTPDIKTAFKNGNLILVLGSGCSLQAKGTNDIFLPTGPAFAKSFATRFNLPISEEQPEPLPELIEAASAGHTPVAIEQYITSSFKTLSYGPEYEKLSRYAFKRIYTLNIDDALYRALSRHSNQQINLYHRNDNISDYAIDFAEIQLIQLHGFVNRPEDGYIFSISDYAEAHANLPKWYNQLATDCISNTVCFIGSDVNEPILFDSITRISKTTSVKASTIITPTINPIRKRSLEAKGFSYIQGTFSDFINYMEREELYKFSALDLAKAARPELEHLLKNTEKRAQKETIEALRQVNLIRPRADNAPESSELAAFYEGFKPTWNDIHKEVPAKLAHTSRLLESLKEAAQSQATKFVPVVGNAGTGKTTAMMQASLELSKSHSNYCIWARDDIDDPAATVRKLESIYKDGYFLFFSSGRNFAKNIEHIIKNNDIKNGVICAPFYLNAWKNKYRANFDNESYCEIELGNIDIADATNILEKVRKYGTWTHLAQKSKEEQVDLLIRKAQGQLLVGLIEATQGTGYSNIIKNDVGHIDSDAAKFICLASAICQMQHSGLPLQCIVQALQNFTPRQDVNETIKRAEGPTFLRNGAVRSRHPVYARRLVERIADISELHDTLKTLIHSFSIFETPVPRNSPREVGQLFKSIVNHRFVIDILRRDWTLIEDVYRNAETLFHSDGAFWLQYGLVKRAQHKHEEALKLLQISLGAYGNARANFAEHALALQHFILADREESESEVRIHMNTAIDILRRQDDLDEFDDIYPITTLSVGHTKTLHKLNEHGAARRFAAEYAERIHAYVRSGFGGRKLSDLHLQLLSYASTGHFDELYWSSPQWRS